MGEAAAQPAPLRLGIVGCGFISERHARAAAASPTVSIVACCDVRMETAEGWSRRYGCERAYDDYLTMVREHELDGVVLATWPNLHRHQILGCLEAGARTILCEKALALSSAEALEIWTAAADADALVVEAYMYRHHPAIRAIDELLAAGQVGAIDNICAAFSQLDHEESSPEDPHVRLPVAWRIDSATEVLVSRSEGWEKFETRRLPIPAVDSFRLQLESFAAAARGEAAPEPPLAESILNAITIDALLSSAAEHTMVAVEVPATVRAHLLASGPRAST